jgi:TRAP-type C4-dicarboxylate transport system permease small subunit
MFKLLGRINIVLAVIGASLLLLISFSICYSVLTRALSVKSPIWIIQFNEYAMLWVTFLAVAWVLAEDKHVSIQIIMSRLGRKGKRNLRLIQNVVCTLLCALLCYLGALSTWEHFRDNVIDVQTVDVPKAYILVVIPLGFFLLFLQFIKRIIENRRREGAGDREHRKPTEDHSVTSAGLSSSADSLEN